jgi:hypothetical protein
MLGQYLEGELFAPHPLHSGVHNCCSFSFNATHVVNKSVNISNYIRLNYRMFNEKWIEKDVDANNHGGNIVAFAWKDWELWKTIARIVDILAQIHPRQLPNKVRNITTWAILFGNETDELSLIPYNSTLRYHWPCWIINFWVLNTSSSSPHSDICQWSESLWTGCRGVLEFQNN